MLIVLIGEGRIHRMILPQVPSGSYILNDKYENTNRRLIQVESQDGKWQITSDKITKIVNPDCVSITNDKINIRNSSELFVSRVVLKEYDVHEVVIGDSKTFYFLCCLPVYEDDWICLNVKRTHEILIGRNPANQISYENELVSDKHARIFLNNGRWMIENYDKKYGTFLNDDLVYDRARFLFNGDTVFIMGLKIVLVGNYLYVNNPMGKMNYDERVLSLYEIPEEEIREDKNEEEKYVELYSSKDYFYRPPRINNRLDKQTIEIVPPPSKKQDDMPLFLTIGTTLSMGLISIISVLQTFSRIGSGYSKLSDNILSIISSVAMLTSTLLMPLAISKWQKKRDKKYEAKRQKKYSEYIATKQKEIDEIKEKQRKILFENYDTTEECTRIILNKSTRLWERIIQDPDFLSINLGIGNVPLDIAISYPQKEAFTMEESDNLKEMMHQFTQEIETLKNAPVIATLTDEKIIAYIDRNQENINKFIQNMLIQLMAFQSYSDLKFVFLLSKENLKRWEYVKLLPYVWNDEKDFRFIEDDTKGMEEISKYLEDEFAKRANPEKGSNNETNYKSFSPYYLIITDDYRKIENLKIISDIFGEKRNLGFTIFCIANDIIQLPNECKTFIDIDGNAGRFFHSEISDKSQIHFTFNNLDTFFFDKIVQMISNIPIKYKLTEKTALPNTYNFLEMYNVGLVGQLNILDRWKNNDATLSLAAPIGINGAGKLINLDIHEKFHGPHGLIAGSTGSGKSEFIITYVLSLALNYHPDDVTFILIDYKGGGLAGAFQKQGIKLPHLVGTITNIDKEGLQRSLISIQSELKRRQILFNEAREMTDGGTIDIYKYQKLYHNGIVEQPIPHLLIICDEFAELKQQQPGFMDELVSVSRIGRSLGVHLILATQKPSGVVDDQIRSNSKFAICLKVQDKSDSSDMLEMPDAAFIKQAGRFYIKVGNGEYLDLGQSGWAGAQYYPSDISKKQKDDSIKFISNIGTVIKEMNDYTKKSAPSKGDQLTNIVKEMHDIAVQENIQAEKLWLDDIPEKIYVKDVKEKYKFKRRNHSVVVTIGEYDDPANQRQGIVSLDLVKGGNLIIYGSADSGRETLMSTIVYDLMETYTAEEVWMYILDFGTETFRIFNGCPNVGEVIFANNGEKLKRFFDRMKEIVNERKQILTEYNGDYNFYLKTGDHPMPLITVLINGYDSFVENYNDIFDDTLLTLTREGLKTGIAFVVVTTACNDLRYRMTQNFKQKIALSLNNEDEYVNIFNGVRNRKPARRFGRGFVNLGEEVYEFQTAKTCEPEEYNVYIKEEIEKAKQRNTTKAEKIPVLPDVVKRENLDMEIDAVDNFPIGLRRKDIKPELYDFRNNFITIMTAKDFQDALQFSANIWQVINELPKVDTLVLDPERKVLCGKDDLSENFEAMLAKTEQKKTNHTICFIMGLDRFANYLEENKVPGGLEEIIKKCGSSKNFSFVIVDSAAKIKEHSYDDWYRKNVVGNNIIWVGSGVNDQYILNTNAPRKDIINDCGCSFGYINKKDKTIMLKLFEMKDKREDDE